jgi:diaminohydroxyphosphoribosylaminopyrimidine deaminase / 5-amino-6-(5-phosphoribosylamino)uracil reductase
MTEHEKHMQRCLELAINGLGNVAPNPMVGAVLVKDGQIIGEGYHQLYGSAHAEVNAVNEFLNHAGSNAGELMRATLYVNLEPCNHYGKTPPCTELIIRHKIPEVVIGCADPNKRETASGIQVLKDSGCKVIEGVLQKESEELNRRFITYHIKKRPYIILKYAQSADGFLAPEKNSGKDSWLTNEWSRKMVHKWRSEEQAIMVGTNTAESDNPRLTTRYWKGKNPLRIVIDRKLRLSPSLHIYNNEARTVVFNELKDETNGTVEFTRINFKDSLIDVLQQLHVTEVQSVIVEGGARLLQSFIERNFWDEARVFTTNKFLISGIKAPIITAHQISEEHIEGDVLSVFRNISSATL